MLFFKNLMNEKLEDETFEQVFKTHCHICSMTVALVSKVEQSQDDKVDILERNQFTPETWEELKQGDCCNPEQVFPACKALGIETKDAAARCPRLKDSLKKHFS